MSADTPFTIRPASWPADEETLQRIRSAVFIFEQGVPQHIEWDGRDGDAQHVIAEINGEAVGCGRLLPDGRIGRLAVLGNHRGTGMGAALLKALVGRARGQGLSEIYLHAQADAVAFYEKAGFLRHGEPFLEAGISHLHMHCHLDYRDWHLPVSRLAYPSPFDELAVAQARQARRELRILSPALDPQVFDRDDLHTAISRFVRQGRQCHLRILVQDARSIVLRSHGLLQLTRRLPSSIEMRRLAEHPDWNGDTQVLRDRDSLLDLPAGETDPAFYRPGDRANCEQAVNRFDELWRVGMEDPEFRSLSL